MAQSCQKMVNLVLFINKLFIGDEFGDHYCECMHGMVLGFLVPLPHPPEMFSGRGYSTHVGSIICISLSMPKLMLLLNGECTFLLLAVL